MLQFFAVDGIGTATATVIDEQKVMYVLVLEPDPEVWEIRRRHDDRPIMHGLCCGKATDRGGPEGPMGEVAGIKRYPGDGNLIWFWK